MEELQLSQSSSPSVVKIVEKALFTAVGIIFLIIALMGSILNILIFSKNSLKISNYS